MQSGTASSFGTPETFFQIKKIMPGPKAGELVLAVPETRSGSRLTVIFGFVSD